MHDADAPQTNLTPFCLHMLAVVANSNVLVMNQPPLYKKVIALREREREKEIEKDITFKPYFN